MRASRRTHRGAPPASASSGSRSAPCWVKSPTGKLAETLKSSKFVARSSVSGKASLSQDYPPSLKEGSPAQLVEIREADYEKEILPVLKEAGFKCGERVSTEKVPAENCPGTTWSRIELNVMVDGPFGDIDPQLPPWVVVVWLDRDAMELHEVFRPSLECGFAEKYQTIVGEHRFSDPRVTFYPYKIDSIDLSSTGLEETDMRGMYLRRTVSTPEGGAVEITLTDKCLIDALGRPTVDSCWTERLALPATGEVWVAEGFSDTAAPRGSIRSLTPADFGRRTSAVQGLYDRSGISLFTMVPQVYRDIGLTTQYSDYRGTRYLDWRHDSAADFGVPGQAHLPGQKLAWNHQPRTFFADWRTDTVIVAHRSNYPMSYCTLPQDMFAIPTKLNFTGGGLPQLATPVQPSQVFTSAPGANGDYRVGPGLWGTASAAQLVSP